MSIYVGLLPEASLSPMSPLKPMTALPSLRDAKGQQQVQEYINERGYGAVLPLIRAQLAAWDALPSGDTDTTHMMQDYLAALLLQADCLLHLGRYDLAKKSCETAFALAGDKPEVRGYLALCRQEELLTQCDDAGETPVSITDPAHPARQVLTAVHPEVTGHGTLDAAYAKDLFLRGDSAGALDLINTAATLNPNHVMVRAVQAELTGHIQGGKAALPIAQELLVAVPQSPLAMSQVIRSQPVATLTAEGRDHAEKLLTRIASIAPGSAHGALAAAHLGLQGRWANGGDGGFLAQWPTMRGPMLSMQLACAQTLTAGGQFAAAQGALMAASVAYPHALLVAQSRADLRQAQNDVDGALEQWATCRKQTSGGKNTHLAMTMAHQYLFRKEYRQAQSLLQEVLATNPNHGAALVLLARAYLLDTPVEEPKALRHGDCEQLARRALNCSPKVRGDAHYMLGLTVDDVDEAAGHLREAIALFANNGVKLAESRTLLVCRLVEAERYEEAQQVLDALPDSAWPDLVGSSDAQIHGLDIIRATRLGNTTIDEARGNIKSGLYYEALVAISNAEDDGFVKANPELYATLKSVKARAYMGLKLRGDARRAANEALATARGYSDVKPMTEALLVNREIAEHVAAERRRWFLDAAARIFWGFLVTAGGLGTVYQMGLSFLATLRASVSKRTLNSPRNNANSTTSHASEVQS